MKHTLACAVLLVGLLPAVAATQSARLTFYPDDPLRLDPDRIDTPVRPEEVDLSELYDRFGHTFRDFGTGGGEARNVNTIDDVPDSSWFTNRHGVRRLTIDELVRGPNTGDGPDASRPWTVFRSKGGGITPGFQIKDGRGDRYILKFDPLDMPELASAAEVIATKLLYAFGYNVPENYIVRFDPASLIVEPGTMVEDRFGDSRPLTRKRLEDMLKQAPRLPDGRIRAMASQYIDGTPLGPFRYYGTRSDDPNDVIPHEHRRELRGLRLLAAWLNHDDIRAINSLDSWVEEQGVRYVRHYLIDFGSTFGSGSVDLQAPHLGFHYWLDMSLVRKNLRSFGFHVPEYRKARWPAFPDFASVGRWESRQYEPQEWKPEYPNPAFDRVTDRDALWAAKIIARFTPAELRAIVTTGEYSDPAHEEYFYQTLVERQRKTAAYYMVRTNPLDEFRVTGGVLEFTNLAEDYGFAEPGAQYKVQWSVFDNATGRTTPLGEPRTIREHRVPLPARPAENGPDSFLLAHLRALDERHPAWDQAVAVYLRPTSRGYEVVGIERPSAAESS